MKPESIKKIAWTVPTTNEELTALGVLGENIIKEYGERLLRAINNFVEKENLSELVAQKPPSKKVKVANVAKLNAIPKPNVPNESFDEFETDVDFGAIDMP
jgi:hypothetical protein